MSKPTQKKSTQISWTSSWLINQICFLMKFAVSGLLTSMRTILTICSLVQSLNKNVSILKILQACLVVLTSVLRVFLLLRTKCFWILLTFVIDISWDAHLNNLCVKLNRKRQLRNNKRNLQLKAMMHLKMNLFSMNSMKLLIWRTIELRMQFKSVWLDIRMSANPLLSILCVTRSWLVWVLCLVRQRTSKHISWKTIWCSAIARV